MLFFIERVALAEQFREWAAERNALDCAENIIAFLSEKGLINEEKIEKRGLKLYEKHYTER